MKIESHDAKIIKKISLPKERVKENKNKYFIVSYDAGSIYEWDIEPELYPSLDCRNIKVDIKNLQEEGRLAYICKLPDLPPRKEK